MSNKMTSGGLWRCHNAKYPKNVEHQNMGVQGIRNVTSSALTYLLWNAPNIFKEKAPDPASLWHLCYLSFLCGNSNDCMQVGVCH